MTTTIDLLGTQHQDVLRRMAAFEAEAAAPAGASTAAFAAFLETEVVQHFVLEEEALFPLMANHLSFDHGPLAVMNAEHATFRELLARLTGAVRAGDQQAQRARAAELIDLLRDHIAKEDHVLLPMALRLLSPAEQEEVDRRAAGLTGAAADSRS